MIGAEHLQRSDFKQAVAYFQRARDALARAATMSLQDAFLRGELAEASMELGIALARSGEHAHAVAAYREGIDHYRALFSGPAHAHYSRSLESAYKDLIASLVALGRSDEAAVAITELRNLVEQVPGGLYDVACYLALSVPITTDSVQKEARAVEAVKMLKRAAASGWSNAASTSRDQRLRPLQHRADFQEVLETMFDRGFPADPFAR